MLSRGYRYLRRLEEDWRRQRFVAALETREDPVSDDRISEARTRLVALLDENLIPFWFPACLDRKGGGYFSCFSADGGWQVGTRKSLVAQARILWFASRLITFGRADGAECAACAEHGFEFLRDRFWDGDRGGFHWEIDCRTGIPLKTNRHLYGQAFGLFALSEFAVATGKHEAQGMADRLFDLIERNAHDPAFDGYHEYLTPDWHPIETDEISYMGHPSTVKQLNTHLHLMEAFTSYARLNGSDLVKNRLKELIRIQSRHVVVEGGIGCTDLHTRDWRKPGDPAYQRVIYGHDLENIWLLIEAHRGAGLPEKAEIKLLERLFESALLHGWDLDLSGFFFDGAIGGNAGQRVKYWWVQAEALLSALHMYILTGRPMYFDVFERVLDWIDAHQADWDHGEWHYGMRPDGSAIGDKASDVNDSWKTPYHSGRALIEGIRLLKGLAGG